MPMRPYIEKWEAFGWQTIEIDGHDMKQILSAVQIAKTGAQKPTAILARTIKGKGVSYMEDDNIWHQKAPTDEQMKLARQELTR